MKTVMAKKIMLADNNERFLMARSEFLRKEGYEVVTAASLTGARRLLEGGEIDLAIIDLRMERDSDDRDISGLMLAKESDSNVPKIILTSYPTTDAVREALTASSDGSAPAVDFIYKTEGLEALLRAVRKALHMTDLSFRSTQDAITAHLHEDYARARTEARTHHRVCLGISLLGIIIVILGAVLALKGDQKTGVASIVAGIITQAITLLFVARLAEAYRRVDKYHEELLQSKRLENLLSACRGFSDLKGQEAAMTKILETTTQNWMKAATGKKSLPARARNRS